MTEPIPVWNHTDLTQEATRYKSTLQQIVNDKELPGHYFEFHDHLAIKAFSEDDYLKLIREFKPFSSIITESWLQGRRIAAARFLGEYALDMQLSSTISPGIVNWLEIMEARIEDQSDEPPRLDHEEIYFPRRLKPIEVVFNRKGLYPLYEGNESHSWVSVIISRSADELKITDERLENIVKKELKLGKAKII